MMRNRSIACVFGILLVVVTGLHLQCTPRFKGRLTDAAGAPVRNALIYLEAYTTQTYAFAWSISGENGEVPAVNKPALRLGMRPGAKLTWCILSDGRIPMVVNDRTGNYSGRPLTIVVADSIMPGMTWNPLLFHLSFPFENIPDLYKQLQDPANRLLLETMQERYKEALLKSGGLSPQALRKARILDSLLGAGGVTDQ